MLVIGISSTLRQSVERKGSEFPPICLHHCFGSSLDDYTIFSTTLSLISLLQSETLISVIASFKHVSLGA